MSPTDAEFEAIEQANNVEAMAWYVQSGLPFAGPEQIADFCAGNPL